MGYCKFNQVESPIAAAVPDVLCLVEQIKVASNKGVIWKLHSFLSF